MFIKAAELGNNFGYAYFMIGTYYEDSVAVEQDRSKAIQFYKLSAKKGSLKAHKKLASFYGENDDFEKSINHLAVAASAGDKVSMDALMLGYKEAKLLSKEDLKQILRAFQTSNDTMKSDDRDFAQ